ncbi:unnamed protein product, partial [Phaeothamnion confervicola]
DHVMIVFINSSLNITDISYSSTDIVANTRAVIGRPFVELLKPDVEKNTFITDTLRHNTSDFPLPFEITADVDSGRACVKCVIIIYDIHYAAKSSKFLAIIFPVWGGHSSSLLMKTVVVGEAQRISIDQMA